MYSYYRKEIPKSIDEVLELHPRFATIIPEIEYYNIPKEIVEILNKNSENVTMNRGIEQVITEKNERMIVFIDVSDIDARKCYSEGDAERVDEDKFQRWYWYKTSNIRCCEFDIKPYIYVEDIRAYNKIQDYIPRTREYRNPIDFSIYYTEDNHIFISPILAEVFKISNIDKLAKKLEEEKGKVFVKE